MTRTTPVRRTHFSGSVFTNPNSAALPAPEAHQ
jgi:hypothetical protein